MTMTPEALTFAEGADATVPALTSVAVYPSNQGKVTPVVPSYVDDSGDTHPLADADGAYVKGEATLTDLTVDSTNATVSPGDSTSSAKVLDANPARKGWILTNMSSAACYVKMGSGASATSFHKRLEQYQDVGQRIMDGDLYTGEVHAVWESDAGGAIVGGDW